MSDHYFYPVIGTVRRSFAVSLLALTTGLASGAIAQTPRSGLNQQTFDQIQSIASDKSKWTSAQKKLDPGLLYASRAAKGQPPVPGSGAPLPHMHAEDVIDGNGFALVDIATTDAAGTVAKIQAAGGSVVSSFPQYNAVRASVPVSKLEDLAGSASVKSIRPAEFPQTNQMMVPRLEKLENRLDNMRVQLAKAFGGGAAPGAQVNLGTGATVSEAVVAHGADIVQNASVTGSGVKVCVMSNGISTLAARQAAGELPNVQILGTGQAGSSGDEGTAMLELVADMAPGASLGFSTANSSKAQFAQNILDLRNVMGCNVIVDDITYFSEGAFQEDIVANAVTTVVNSGAMYFSSAANSGHLSGGQSGTWEGDFLDGGAVFGPIAAGGETGNFHNFGTAGSPVLFDTLTASASRISLQWADPLGAAGDDYDVYVVNAAGTTVLGFSAAIQNGTQDAFEFISGSFPSGSRIYIVKFSGAARALRLDSNRSRLSIATNGSTFGHNGGVKTITVAAVSNNFAPISGRKLNASDTITTYSSDGPRKLFLNPTPATSYITSGCATFACAGGGGTLLPKVDISAADCDTTTTPGFIPFCGTSAAAPQAAAIAALVKSSAKSLTGSQILSRMRATAIDIMVAGRDVDSGSGIVMADAAVNTRTTFPHDLNGDSAGDILWRDQTNGNAIVSLVNNASITSSAFAANLPLSWTTRATGDFNGDGRSDILWRDASGNYVVSFMNAAGGIASSSFLTNLAGGWSVSGTGDFNGDGTTDILWSNLNTGDRVVSFVVNGNIVFSQFIVNLPLAWLIAGVGDLNSDGRADIVWYNNGNGNVVASLMNSNGTVIASSTFLASLPTWTLTGLADFNGDGRKDILWRDATGATVASLIAANGSAISSSQFLVTLGTPWTVALLGDYNGDGRSDILWRNNTTGATVASLIGPGGTTISSSSLLATLPTNFEVQSLNQN
ncbi:FG-GAP-like repeat-containing protein [Methylocystis parvus]|uniref:S8 family serine peptidase n=1 Tax=Methylocystis parvus TaxID=134 RepID=A0A6B8M4J5_9HYPH|nr:FG-GAP-like repeat-containing protein [Methylocystis parvus]QGM97821.1 S8 family serine peptidase [Methylocystis parvus]WBK01870.1 FG-GAP-like repeat-containing protein [Methylocystis parvus OBBP]